MVLGFAWALQCGLLLLLLLLLLSLGLPKGTTLEGLGRLVGLGTLGLEFEVRVKSGVEAGSPLAAGFIKELSFGRKAKMFLSSPAFRCGSRLL